MKPEGLVSAVSHQWKETDTGRNPSGNETKDKNEAEMNPRLGNETETVKGTKTGINLRTIKRNPRAGNETEIGKETRGPQMKPDDSMVHHHRIGNEARRLQGPPLQNRE